MQLSIMTGQAFSADSLSIKIREMIPLDSTAIWDDLKCPVPSRINSSSLKVMVLVPTIWPTICCKSFATVPSGTQDSFRIFSRASRCVVEDNRRDSMDICAGYFFNCQTTEYSFLFKVLINSTASTLLNVFFFCDSSAKTSFPFLFLSSVSTNSFG